MSRKRIAAILVAACALSLVAFRVLPASAQITGQSATNTASTVTYTYRYTGSPAFLRVYVDTDRNAATGYAGGGVGAEFLLENAALYRHNGSGWSWTQVATVTHSGSGGTATWTVNRADLGETATPNDADLVFQTESPLDTSAKYTHVYSGGGTSPSPSTGPGTPGTVTYQADGTVFANPERGFYHHTTDCDAADFNQATLTGYRTNENISLVMCIFYLASFKNSAISADALARFQRQADTVRAAGLKMIVRFAYTTSEAGDDAPVSRVLQHLDQLAPYLRNNVDVIHVVQAGFVGAWGEWWYTQNFGNAGNVTQADWANRKAVVDKLLSVLPSQRMVQLRTPKFKRTLYGTTPVSSGQAYGGSTLARVGHHNDCFLASADDFGTYENPSVEYPYLASDTQFVAMGGETCAPNAPRSECATATQEMAQFHWNYLNADYRPEVLSSWSGCIADVRRNLGHRFQLTTGTYPTTASGTLAVRFAVRNVGYAAPFNPRGLELVLRNTSTGTVYKRQLSADPRRWASGGTSTVDQTVSLSGVPAGSYRLLLNLPDGASSLASRPEYSLRLANTGVWEPATGFNDLQHTVTVS
ncbi:hypothetical protein Val02_51090 [Virgisporangium aliadipatigenens]|uniref:DUF4832 domain-containing protein n=1 Tax=Virgisporangium aliadipatigenens TaxID=741659 RepID=A0A8J4DST8_9ACTN|nr:DUF4832 domain-containing protein [Virgisporangium aliadipatigenens]GIJ48223.1 hypothetical protein Val02_51090 [Virgisporangium aliadipatigenens]